MKRRARIELGAVLAATVQSPELDDLDTRVLDAAEHLLRSSGLRRWSIDDVAAAADVGRTSVYRRFDDRDNLVHAVLARELRRTLRRIRAAADSESGLEDKAVAAVSEAVGALDGSVVDALLRTDPETFLPYLTTEAGPLVDIARGAITQLMADHVDEPSPELAEVAARFGLSLILTRSTIIPVDDPAARAEAVRRMVRPLLGSLSLGH